MRSGDFAPSDFRPSVGRGSSGPAVNDRIGFPEREEDRRQDTRHFSTYRGSVPLIFFPFRYWNPGGPERNVRASLDERFIAAFSGCPPPPSRMNETQSFFPPGYTGNKHEERSAILHGKWSKLKDEDGRLNEKMEREGSAWITSYDLGIIESMAADLSDPPKLHPTSFICLGAIFAIPSSLFSARCVYLSVHL